ncbi:MAG: hypothetical protein LH628_05405 [Microcoleus sp. CAN_BIN18]|nr:hypothetical protein [Microcoleus sp. CAN_BIN18]
MDFRFDFKNLGEVRRWRSTIRIISGQSPAINVFVLRNWIPQYKPILLWAIGLI